MYAITIKQPWLWAILRVGKKIENRTWKPPDSVIGQRIALHASKEFDPGGAEAIDRIVGPAYEMPVSRACQTGAILAVATLVHVTQIEDLTKPVPKWAVGPWCWALTNVLELREPIPTKGALGLWKVSPATQYKIETQKKDGPR